MKKIFLVITVTTLALWVNPVFADDTAVGNGVINDTSSEKEGGWTSGGYTNSDDGDVTLANNPIDPCDILISETCREELTEKTIYRWISLVGKDLPGNDFSGVLIQNGFIIAGGESSGSGFGGKKYDDKYTQNSMV